MGEGDAVIPPEWPDWAKDQVVVQVDVQFDWRDRLRLLLSGKLWLTVRTWTEVPPGRVDSYTTVRVLRRRPAGPTVYVADVEQ